MTEIQNAASSALGIPPGYETNEGEVGRWRQTEDGPVWVPLAVVTHPLAVADALNAMRMALACIEAHVPTTTFAPRVRLRKAIDNLVATSFAPRVLTWAGTNEIERQIVERIILSALDAGCTLTINNGGDEDELCMSRDLAAIGEALGAAGYDVITLHRDGERLGFVHLIYGNGAEVIADHTARAVMDDVLREAFDLAERLGLALEDF